MLRPLYFKLCSLLKGYWVLWGCFKIGRQVRDLLGACAAARDMPSPLWEGGVPMILQAQRLQYPLIKEYILSLIRVPIIIEGIFLNYGILGSLGATYLGSPIEAPSGPIL